MARSVRFDDYGPVDSLYLADVDEPSPADGQVVVRVVATSINPGEAMIRAGGMKDQAPSTFPSGEGSDLAGRVAAVGPDVTAWSVGDEVYGWTDERAAQADFVTVPPNQLLARPGDVAWEQLASLYVAGGTANAVVQAVGAKAGDTVAVLGATGGVGSIVVQLLHNLGGRVLAVAGDANADWLRGVGAEPVAYGDGLSDRLRDAAPDGIDAAIDTHGDGYVKLAVDLGVAPDRIATIIDFEEGPKLGAQVVLGYETTTQAVMKELGDMLAAGDLTIPIAATYPLDQVQDAYRELAGGHTLGKIVLTTGA